MCWANIRTPRRWPRAPLAIRRRVAGVMYLLQIRGTIQGANLVGDWADVPIGRFRNKGSLVLHGTDATVPLPQETGLGTWSTSNGIFGGYRWDKMYDA